MNMKHSSICSVSRHFKIKVEQMGSLMAGWDCPVPDPKTVKLERNKSVTREEIEAFWKSRKKTEELEDREKDPAAVPVVSSMESCQEVARESERNFQTKKGVLEMETQTSLENLMNKIKWWTSSSSAFLNQPPVTGVEGLHVAVVATSKSHHPRDGITTA
ncbi:hypothetical protein NMG60_11024361 [Bertholletia excelsa]